MKRVKKVLLIATMFIALPCAVNADQDEANACAANLSDVGKKMFHAVAPALESGDDMGKKSKAILKPLVKSGEISKSDARANSKAVKACLEKLAT